MSEKILNQEVLEIFAKEVMKMESKEQVESFVNTFVYSMIGLV